MKVPAFKDNQPLESKIRQDKNPNSANFLGNRGDYLPEDYLLPEQAKSEKRFIGENGQCMSMIRDTETDIGTGYGNQTGAGAISIGVGYGIGVEIDSQPGETREPITVIRDRKKVAAEIYISQKTSADGGFFADGASGEIDGKSAIVFVADTHRIWGKESIKFITGVGDDDTITNSGGAPIRSVGRFDFIAGNDDSNISPVVKGEKLNSVVLDLYDQIDKSNSMFDSFNTTQTEYNGKIMTHDHLDLTVMLVGMLAYGNPFAINNGKGLPSPELVVGGMKTLPRQYILKVDALMQKLQTAFAKINGTDAAGDDNPSSPSFFVT